MSELLAEVKAARRAEKALDRHTGRIKELLVDVRLANRKLKVADLEAEIDRFYDRATISRITYPAMKAADLELGRKVSEARDRGVPIADIARDLGLSRERAHVYQAEYEKSLVAAE